MAIVSIIIRCLNEEKHIGRLLSGILEQTVKEVEIIVVDSGSQDATLSIASRFPVNIVQIRPQDFSFGYALNAGCAAASGDVLIFASAHVYPVFNDWIAQMMAPFQNEKVALVYGKQRGNEVTKYSEHQIFATWFPDSSTQNQRHPFCNNANCAIRRSLWKDQAFDETLTGLEDLDWAKKIIDKGWQIAYQADATIIHVHEERWKNIYNRYRREAIALRAIQQSGGFNFITFLMLFLRNVWSDYRHAWSDGILARNLKDIFLFRLMQFWGTYRGYKQSYKISDELRQRFYYPKGYRRKPASEDTETSRKIDYTVVHRDEHQ
ncbi:MAG: glycosyltransferase family 2 protein [Saprospiraceae bacterium]|nr:glycosyltransferase family 2 protein [Saprospiraceae bacterium]MDZ4705458.1 glycosyltransferase family 2 protein [Saprospiraceae bacterium]